MGTQEWFALAGIILTVMTGLAIPFIIVIVKMWAAIQMLTKDVDNIDKAIGEVKDRMNRADTEKVNLTTAIFNQIGATNDRINEHAEQLADHGARVSNNEGEIKNLRRDQEAGRRGNRTRGEGGA